MTTSSDTLSLRLLEDQVIGLTLQYPGGHGTTYGRVKLVPASPAIWVGDFCLDWETQVRPDSFDKGEYTVNLR
jgi:hypothetical protein